MFFMIAPQQPIGTEYFRVGNYYLGKDKTVNQFIGWLWEISECRLVIDNDEIPEKMLSRKEIQAIYKRAKRAKTVVEQRYYLNKQGVALLHDVFGRLGEFRFEIYKDDGEPSIKQLCLDIKDIGENLCLSFDVTWIVTHQHNFHNN